MKKMLAILLAATMLFGAALALAEGPMTEKPITFSGYNYGDTFGSVRSGTFIRNIDFKRAAYTSRYLCDALTYMAEWNGNGESTQPFCFSSSPDNMSTVAGYNAQSTLWFVYPQGASSDNDAVLYAGEYNFFDGDAQAIYEDLLGKLAKVYGEPYYTGNSLDEALDAAAMDEGMLEHYNEQVSRYNANYAVWKSSANGGVVVLKNYMENGDWNRTLLTYADPSADALFPDLSSPAAAAGDSLEGL